MIKGGKLRAMRQVIYRLKRGFGLPLVIQYQLSNSVNFSTGVMAASMAQVKISRAILLPATYHKDFKYDIGYLKANSNFTYGGLVTSGTRQVIVAGEDLPSGFEPKVQDDYTIICDNKRYNIKRVEALDLKVGFFISMEYVSGVLRNELHVEAITDPLVLGQTAGGTTT